MGSVPKWSVSTEDISPQDISINLLAVINSEYPYKDTMRTSELWDRLTTGRRLEITSQLCGCDRDDYACLRIRSSVLMSKSSFRSLKKDLWQILKWRIAVIIIHNFHSWAQYHDWGSTMEWTQKHDWHRVRQSKSLYLETSLVLGRSISEGKQIWQG